MQIRVCNRAVGATQCVKIIIIISIYTGNVKNIFYFENSCDMQYPI